MIKYDKYKDSGVDWLGSVPEHWEVRRIKDLTSIISKGTTPSTEGKPYTNVGVRFIKAENIIENGQVSDTPEFYISEETNNALNRSKLKSNDLLLVIAGATTGKIAILKEHQLPANTNQAVCFLRLRCSEKQKSFLFKYYFINSKYFQDLIWLYAVSSAQPNLPMAILSRFNIYYPPLNEQSAIATYLESKTSTIDRKVSLLEQKTTHYQQLRKSLIKETVCRGLNKNLKLKDSGLEFIGLIPEHWEVKRLKDMDEIIMGQSPNSEDYNYDFIGFPFLQGNAEFGLLHPSPSTWCSTANKVINTKNILVSVRAPIGAINIADRQYGIGRGLCAVRAKKSLYKFLYYHFSVRTEDLNSVGTGTTYIAISLNGIRNLFVAYPPIEEQVAISNYLDEKTQKIDSIVSNIKTQIETLKELRKTLINDVVTGKIKVTP